MSECPGVNRCGCCGGAATEIDAPVEKLDGIVDRTLGRLLQNRLVEGSPRGGRQRCGPALAGS